MDRDVHTRYLRYREAFAYFAQSSFGAGQKQLDPDAFEKADAEQIVLERKARDRTDEEEARFVELTVLLFRD
jgi:hypothetical protein